MTSRPDLHEWNRQSLAVVQAMLGMISPNFRRVALDHDGNQWLITFVLQGKDVADLEEIEDFATEWDALQSGPEPREIQTIITSGFLHWPAPPKRVLYQRREPAMEQG